MDELDEAKARTHEAIGGFLVEGELAISWCLTIDIAGPDDTRYLAHRSGGGADGSDSPMVWAALGMLEASVGVARDQLRDCTRDADEEDDDA